MYGITLGTRESLDMNSWSLNLDQMVSFVCHMSWSLVLCVLYVFSYVSGRLRYANNSNYKNDTMIRKEVGQIGGYWVGTLIKVHQLLGGDVLGWVWEILLRVLFDKSG